MSRAATATPPPPSPYFPQRTSTPTMRHCANPSVNASHFAPRQYQYQHQNANAQQLPTGQYKSNESAPASGTGSSGQRRKIKHLPSSLGGLRRKSSRRHAEAEADDRSFHDDDITASTLSHVPSVSSLGDDESSFDSVRTTHSSRSDRSDRSNGSSVPSFGSFSSGNSADSTTLPTPTTATGSFVLQQFPDPDPAELEHVLSSKSFAYAQREGYGDVDVHMDEHEHTPTATPTQGIIHAAELAQQGQGQGGSNKSWVPHFGFGQLQLAKARAAVSTGLASFGEKRRRDGAAHSPKDLSLGDVNNLPNIPAIDTNFFTSAAPGQAQRRAELDALPASTSTFAAEDVIRADATFKPMAEMTTPPAELLAACQCTEDADRVREEWANAQRARLTQCAQLCSQWPLSGYHLSKFGPNGARHCYEPQSFSNPAHVANLMHRQSELELTLCRESGLHFPAAGTDKYAYRDVKATPPSPTVSDDDNYALRTADELRRAMASDLLSISVPASANSSQVSLVPFAPEYEVRPMHVKRKSAPAATAARNLHLSELNGFASSMALTQQAGVSEEPDMDDGDTDTTSLAPSLSSLRDSCDLSMLRESRDTHSSRAASGSGFSRPSLQGLFPHASTSMTRPARAQSCGSKRPPSDVLAGSSSAARASRAPGAVCSGTGEEDKRRKVDEAMVVEEAVSTGVIMPEERAGNLGQAEELHIVDDPMERMCASTPDLGSLRSRSAMNVGTQDQRQQGLLGLTGPRAAPNTLAYDARGNAHAGDFGHPHARAFTAPAAPNHGSSAAVFGHIVKTSDTHPIIISPFFPDELLPVLTRHLILPDSSPAPLREEQGKGRSRPLRMFSEIDVVSTLLSHVPSVSPSPVQSVHEGIPGQAAGGVEVVRSPSWLASAVDKDRFYMDAQKPPVLGNLLLSSCPGKRLRMDGPVKGRGPVCRDLKTDLERIKAEGVGCLVCCLDDAELALLGVPWETYRQVASEIGLDIVRLPMPDGFTPVSISLFDAQISLIATRYTLRGINVLVHCRGGVGRAGLTASAWAIKMGYVQPHPSLALVEQRAMEQARERHAEQVLAQQRRQEQQQQSATPTRGYKGFSLFPRSTTGPSSPMDRTSSERSSSSSAMNMESGGLATASAEYDTPLSAPAPAIPAELEHQIVMSTVERVIAMIRARRGLKAIESFEQVQFLVEYVRWMRAESRI